MKHWPLIRDSLIFFTCIVMACGADGIVGAIIH